MPDERVAVFIDGSNLFHCLKEEFGRLDLNFDLFVAKLVGGRRLIRTYYFAAPPRPDLDAEAIKKQQRFLDALRSKDYFQVRLGRLIKHEGKYHEKGVDVLLAVEMIQLAPTYDTAILVSGDGDLVAPVGAVQRLGKHVENASTPSTLARELRQECDKGITLDEAFLAGCWMSSPKISAR